MRRKKLNYWRNRKLKGARIWKWSGKYSSGIQTQTIQWLKQKMECRSQFLIWLHRFHCIICTQRGSKTERKAPKLEWGDTGWNLNAITILVLLWRMTAAAQKWQQSAAMRWVWMGLSGSKSVVMMIVVWRMSVQPGVLHLLSGVCMKKSGIFRNEIFHKHGQKSDAGIYVWPDRI